MSAVTGGAAFPQLEKSFPCQRDEGSVYFESSGGMTLRDYFAAKALAALISSPNATQEWIVKSAVKSAYNLADSMLVERAK